MTKTDLRLFLCCFVMCLLTGAIVFVLVSNEQRKIGVVDAVKLFGGFNMKQELEGIAKIKLQEESKDMDSVRNAMQMTRAMNNEDATKTLMLRYNSMKAKLESDYTQSDHDINEQVWKRLNPLLVEFGKKRGLHLIIGANGMGTVLYNDEHYDLTNDVIKFVNKRYAEGN